MSLNPYIKPKFETTTTVMVDVIIALLPLSILSYIAYGMQAIQLQLLAIGVALVTELISAVLVTKNYRSILDGSAVVTALLMCFTISPITPWYIVAFGAASAILFGKIVWGGLGKNRFNPALVGREFMATFFPVIMTSAGIWATTSYIQTPATHLFPGLTSDYLNSYLSGLVYKTSGAMGEYSIVAIAIGGLYLLIRNRISWHIPFALLAVFFACFWFVPDGDDLKFSLAGVLLGTIFMATDMPSSPTNTNGKLYYGGMIGLVTFLLLLGKVSYEYMSFSILILNGFSRFISLVFKPKVWGQPLDWQSRIEQIFLLTLAILGVTLAVISLDYYHMIPYLVYVYIVYIIFKFNFSFLKNISNPI
ncbi:electron transport complex protein RnfD [Pustulibacterium marinum]|uniref:Electron transport complex protein RnfD n=1 Tax=Pustulibacterium marinum TaxID=1224947 RepID=A0A1I7G4N4_9FLAO|nr:RnfABCDGE type electron transport complex subunit D [Pustulibacterium marinum]SFU43176.1 electron transport complex protein RnfD [Pustulibacterium marinum]